MRNVAAECAYRRAFRSLRRIGVLSAILAIVPLAAAAAGQQWFSAWTVALDDLLTTPMSGTGVRMIVRPSISGSAVRIRLENRFGQSPVVLSAAYIGQWQSGAAVVPGSNTQLTFNGNSGLTLAAGAGAYSDPLAFPITAFQRYAISVDVASASDISSHSLGLVTNYVAVGAHAADPGATAFTPIQPDGPSFPFYWLDAVDVESASTTGAIVALGDSITDGACSTRTDNGGFNGVVLPDLYNRWTDVLATRLAGLPASQSKSMADEGIAGNTVVVTPGVGPTAIARMNNDVLSRAGVTHVIFFEGTNDIAAGAAAATVIAGDEQIIDRAHAAGLKIVGATLLPRGKTESWSTSQVQERAALNDWIRHQANFDGVIDFDSLMQGGPVDAANGATTIQPQWSCYDGVHPNSAGYAAMGAFIDLGLFQVSGGPRFAVSAPAAAAPGAPFNFAVTALDANGNTLAGYSGTVHFTSSDAAATLPPNAALVNGAGTFSAVLQTAGSQTITATDTVTSSISGASAAIAVAAGSPPAPGRVSPAAGGTSSQAMTFTFLDPAGSQDLGVVNILINDFLDGRQACYLAYSQPLNALYLENDTGTALLGGTVLTAAGNVSNSQCAVSWTGSPVARSNNTLTLTLTIAFAAGFAGNKVIYLAARTIAGNNSGWQPLGVWQVPGAVAATTTAVIGMNPSSGAGLGPTAFTFSFSDTKGYTDLGVMNILVNNSLDGQQACYLAYARSINVLYLVNDTGDALLPGQSLGGAGSLSNTQCTVAWGVGAVNGSGNSLALALNMTFSVGFGGGRIFYLAARDGNGLNNTGWQAMGARDLQ